jgi:hypothetical protein
MKLGPLDKSYLTASSSPRRKAAEEHQKLVAEGRITQVKVTTLYTSFAETTLKLYRYKDKDIVNFYIGAPRPSLPAPGATSLSPLFCSTPVLIPRTGKILVWFLAKPNEHTKVGPRRRVCYIDYHL